MKSLILVSLLFWAPEKAKKIEIKAPPIKPHQKLIVGMSNWIENMDNSKFYKGVKFTSKNSKSVVNFSSLNNFQKQMFYIVSAENVLLNLEATYKMWMIEAKQPFKGSVPPETLKRYATELKKLMGKATVKWEKIVKDTFEKHGDKISKEEKNVYLKKMEIAKKRISKLK